MYLFTNFFLKKKKEDVPFWYSQGQGPSIMRQKRASSPNPAPALPQNK